MSKRKRVDWSLARLAEEDVPAIAGRMLDGWLPASLDAATRNAIQDILWAGEGALEIPRKTRRDIGRALDLRRRHGQRQAVHGPPGPLVGPGR